MYKRVDPVDISVMLRKRYHGHHTICETLREIYLLSENEDIKLKCRIAMAMSKRMHEKLKWYREKDLKCMSNKNDKGTQK